MENQIYDIIDSWGKKYTQPARQFKTHPEIKQLALDFLKNNFNINENEFKGSQNNTVNSELYWFLKNRRTSFPICPITGKRTSYRDKGEYCKYSENVSSKDIEFIEKRKQSIKEKYGVDCSLQTNIAKEKSKETCLKKYGVPHHMMNQMIHEKCIINCQTDKAKEKRKQTCLNRYGFVSYQCTPENQVKATKVKRTKSYENLQRFKDYVKPLFTLEEWIEQKETYKWLDVQNNIEFESSYKGVIPTNHIYHKTDIEKFIIKFLDDNNINYEYGNRSILNGKEIDLYLPNFKIGIELHGLFWHSELFRTKNYHYEKYVLAKEKGIQLIQIFGDEIKYKPNIVISRLENKLKLFKQSIFARKCTIKEISFEEKCKFLNTYHIQGNDNSSIKIGAYYNNELIGLMTFGFNRFAKNNNNNEYELYRYCLKEGIKSTGLASKIFKYFIKKYNPYKITTYADLRWGDGNFYKQLGFKYIHTSLPNYFYFKSNQRYSRIMFQKHKLQKLLPIYDENLSEHDNMFNNGYLRIYDCGNNVYQWIK